MSSKASKVEQALVIGLGGLNLAGVVILSSMLRYQTTLLVCLVDIELY
jgi:hypothetical protein